MDVRDYIEANAGEYFAVLKEWLSIPSISEAAAYLWDELAAELAAGRRGDG